MEEFSSNEQAEHSSKPYLVRAIWQWAMDTGATPQLLVNTQAGGVDIPAHLTANDTVVLNIHDQAVLGLRIDDDAVHFSARFNGVAHQVYIPMDAVVAVYDRASSHGLFFKTKQPSDPSDHAKPLPELADSNTDDSQPSKPASTRPTLKLVE